MKITNTQKILIVIVIILVCASLVYMFMKNPGINNTSQSLTGTSTNVSVNTQGTGGGNMTIEKVPIIATIPKPIPDLDRTITFPQNTSFPPDAQALVVQKITGLEASLKKDPTSFESWIDLGLYRKMTEDYIGTSLAWQYASKLIPTDFISQGDLGDLYAYYLKDNGKAEMYYKQAILNGPTQVYLYFQLAEVYRDVFKDMDKARAIVDQGLTKIPNNPDLLKLKDSLK